MINCEVYDWQAQEDFDNPLSAARPSSRLKNIRSRIGMNLFLYSLAPTAVVEMASAAVEDNGHAMPLGEAALIGTGIGLAVRVGIAIAESVQ